MEDEKLADKLLDRILMVLMPYDQIDVERIKANASTSRRTRTAPTRSPAPAL